MRQQALALPGLRDEMEETEPKRLLGRARAIVALAAAIALVPAWLALPTGSHALRRVERWFHRLIVRGNGLQVRLHGVPRHQAGTLFIANHVSWIDIPVLASVVDAAFVAKDDVAGWPVIGALARRQGTIFIARDRPREAAAQQRELARRLARHGVILFPEGTTSLGSGLLPFRTSLFAAAAGARAVQPVALVYGRRDGAPMTERQRRAIAWLDDDALLPHAMRLAMLGGLCVDIHFEEPLDIADRKLLAQTCRQRILDRLAGGGSQAAALNRVA